MKKGFKLALIVGLALVLAMAFALPGCAPKVVTPPPEVPPEEVPPAVPEVEVIEWRYGSTWTPAINLIEYDRRFIKIVNEMTGGRLVLTLYPAGEIVPAFELFDTVSKGVLEAGGEWPSYWAGKNIAFDLMGSQNFGLTPLDHITWTYQGGGLELMRELFGRYNIHYIPIGMTPSESGFRTNRPIRTLADYEGLTLRTPATQTMWVLEQVGAKPVKIPGGEIYMALKLGTIDGAEFSNPSCDWGMKFHEMTKYWCLPCWFQPSSLIGCMINMDAWNELPDDLKAIVEEAGKATITWSQAYARWSDITAVKNFEEYGIENVWLEEEAILELEALAIEFYEMKAAESADYAKVLKSMMSYLKSYEGARNIEGPWGFGRNLTVYPKIP